MARRRTKTERRIARLVSSGAFTHDQFPRDAKGHYGSTARHRALRWDRQFGYYARSSEHVLIRPESAKATRALKPLMPEDLRAQRSGVVAVRVGETRWGVPRELESLEIIDTGIVRVTSEGRVWIMEEYSIFDKEHFLTDPVGHMQEYITKYGRRARYHVRVGKGYASKVMTGKYIEEQAIKWASYESVKKDTKGKIVSITPLSDFFEGIAVEIL